MEKSLDTKKYIDFSEEDIEDYLKEIHHLVNTDNFTISQTDKNLEFISAYNLNTEKIKKIIMKLNYKDFCYAADNYNPKFPDEILYVFCVNKKLDYWGEIQDTNIYIKFNKLCYDKRFCYIVSLHEPEKPIEPLFN